MAKYRGSVRDLLTPSDPNKYFFGDAGSETAAIFNEGLDLPEGRNSMSQFALFMALKEEKGRKFFTSWTRSMIVNARESGAQGYILDSPTFRSSLSWAQKLGLSPEEFKDSLTDSIKFCEPLIKEHDSDEFKVLFCALLGPADSGYSGKESLTIEESQELHQFEIDLFSEQSVDFVGAVCMTYVDEVVGIVNACKAREMPVMVSFTLETDGKLPSGMTLAEAIEAIDAATDSYPIYYQINCAHFDHFSSLFVAEKRDSAWFKRVRSLRPNASRKSHAELDECSELDAGDPVEFGKLFGQMKKRMPHLTIFCGCCGTDLAHLQNTGVTLKALTDH